MASIPSKFSVLAAAIVMASMTAQAAENDTYSKGYELKREEPVTKEKETGFVPSVEVKEAYTDNVYRSRKNERHSWITTVKPGGELRMKKGAQKFTLGANTEGGWYSIDSRNDYVDWAGYGRAQLELDSRNRFDLNGKISHGHDPIGTGGSEGSTVTQDEPDEYTQHDADVKYIFGADKARGRFILRDIYMNKEYTNNRESTDRLDRTENEVRATAYLRVMPKTTLLVEGREKSINYLKDYRTGNPEDSNESKQFVGVEWDATAKTTGSFRIGQMEKDFDEKHGRSIEPDDYESPLWESSITWSPQTFNRFTLDFNKTPSEVFSGTGYIDRTDTKLSWKYDWSSALKSRIFIRHYTDDYRGQERLDHTNALGVGAMYQVNRWLDLKADYIYEDKNSNRNQFDYNANLFVVGAKVAFD